jgi:hypothetical protein
MATKDELEELKQVVDRSVGPQEDDTDMSQYVCNSQLDGATMTQPSLEDVFLSTRHAGLLKSRFKIPPHLTYREHTLLQKRRGERKSSMLKQDQNTHTCMMALDTFEENISNHPKGSITLKDVIAANMPCDQPLTLNG